MDTINEGDLKQLVAGIETVDVHGCTQVQAQTVIDSRLRRATAATYRIRIIHGYSRGTALRDMIRTRYAKHPKVLRVELGLNPGETDLILREL